MNTEPKPGKESEKMASVIQKAALAGSLLKLGKSLGMSAFLVILAASFIYLGVPWYFGAAIILLAVAVVGVEVMSIKKAAAVKLNARGEASSDAAIELEPGEHLVEVIPAVMQYGKTRSVTVLGTGQVLTPENALLITNKAIWALTVPLAGADKVVAGTDIGKWQFMTAWQEIADKLQEMLNTLPLDEVLKQGRANRLLKMEELKAVKTLPFTFALCFIASDGKKYGYSVRDKKDYERAKAFFKI